MTRRIRLTRDLTDWTSQDDWEPDDWERLVATVREPGLLCAAELQLPDPWEADSLDARFTRVRITEGMIKRVHADLAANHVAEKERARFFRGYVGEHVVAHLLRVEGHAASDDRFSEVDMRLADGRSAQVETQQSMHFGKVSLEDSTFQRYIRADAPPAILFHVVIPHDVCVGDTAIVLGFTALHDWKTARINENGYRELLLSDRRVKYIGCLLLSLGL